VADHSASRFLRTVGVDRAFEQGTIPVSEVWLPSHDGPRAIEVGAVRDKGVRLAVGSCFQHPKPSDFCRQLFIARRPERISDKIWQNAPRTRDTVVDVLHLFICCMFIPDIGNGPQQEHRTWTTILSFHLVLLLSSLLMTSSQ
jgi:hypothetical protein